MNNIIIADREVGPGHPVFIIAELSCNHRQNYELAITSIDAIKKCGADAVKLSTDRPDGITLNCNNDFFQIKQGTIWDGQTLYSLYQETDTPWDWQPKLKAYAESLGLICFSTPTCFEGVDFLQSLNVPCFKIASFEITDIPLIKKVASLGKPIIISTGIAQLEDIELAVETCRSAGNNQIILLKCTSAYPTSIDEMNLQTMVDIKSRFNVTVGLSDHSVEIYAPIVATSLGASVIEKHFILDRSLGGPDSAFSLNASEFKQMVADVRMTEKALGSVTYNLTNKIAKNREFSKSLFVGMNMKKGDVFTSKNLKIVRPGFGMHPKYYDSILGKKCLKDLEFGTPLKQEYIEED